MTALATSPGRRFLGLREFAASVSTMMVKELRSRFRGRRAFVVLTVYLGVLALIAYGAYAVVAPNARLNSQLGRPFDLSATNASATIGQAIFSMLSVFQLILVAFIAPAFTAGAVSLEREKQTLDLLIATPMRPGAIVVGKLLSALAFVILMVVAAIPLSALVLMYGGATLDDIVRQQIVLLVTAIGLGSIGLFWSALVKRTQAATVLTYVTVLVFTIGTMLIFIFWSALNERSSENPFGVPRPAPEQLMWVNPAVAMADVVAQTELGGYGLFSLLVNGLLGNSVTCEGDRCFPVPPVQDGVVGVTDIGVAPGVADCPPNARCAAPPPAAVSGPTLVQGHFWPRYSLTFAGLSLLLTAISMRLVVPAGMRFRLRRTRVVAPATNELALDEVMSPPDEPVAPETDR